MLEPSSILEIGIGTRFLTDYLRKWGYEPITMDIEPAVKPHVVGDVRALPFRDESFDTICCFQVLEHLPYSEFQRALAEIQRVVTRNIVISLPDVSRHYRFLITIPKIGEVKRLIEVPRRRNPLRVHDEEHQWEIGMQGYPLKKIKTDLTATGLDIINTYRVFEYPYHRFFILKKRRG